MVGGGVTYEHKTRTLYGNVLIFGKGVWSSKVSRFGDLGNLGEINVSLGSSGENALQSLYPLQVGKSVEYSIIESAAQNSNSMWEYDDEWNLKTTVREVQTVNIAGQDFSTILLARILQGQGDHRSMTFDLAYHGDHIECYGCNRLFCNLVRDDDDHSYCMACTYNRHGLPRVQEILAELERGSFQLNSLLWEKPVNEIPADIYATIPFLKKGINQHD